MKTFSGKTKYALVFLFLILAVNFLMAQKLRPGAGDDERASGHNPEAARETMPQATPSGPAVVQGNGINYHGGPVLKGNPVPIYVIWYGNWNSTGSDTQTTVNLIDTFLNSLGNTGYERINTTYGDATGNVSGNLTLAGQVFDPGSQGTKLRNSRISAAISAQLTSGALPTDPNGVYLFLTASDIREN